MRHRQQAIFHEGLVVDQLQDTAREGGLLRQGGCRTLRRWEPRVWGPPPRTEAAEGRRGVRRDPRAPAWAHSGASGTPGAAPRPWQSHTRGDACTSAQTRWQSPGTSTAHSPHRWGYRPLGCPPGRPSLLQQLHRARERQCGGGVNATLRRAGKAAGTRDCRQDRFLEALWDTGRGARHRPSCLSECPWLSARFLVALKGAARR